MSLLSIEGLDAGYNGVAVVRGLDVSVEAGEVVTVLGPNGAGKTTTLLTATGVLPSISGRITVGDQDVTRSKTNRIARLGLALVPDDRSLFGSLTVKENLALGCRRGRPDLARLFEWFPPLEPILDRPAAVLSGGEQQMLVIARALVGRPSLLLVDELSMGLAPIIVSSILPVLRRAADEDGLGVLLVEQHMHLALATSDRAYVLRQGEVVMAGTARELLEDIEVVERSYLGDGQAPDPALNGSSSDRAVSSS